MSFSWSLFVDLGLISLALLVSTLIRAKVPFFQKYLIPNALTAGFILLPVYNFLLPALGYDRGGLENVVYHCLSLSFVAMSLRHGSAKGAGRRIFSASAMTVSSYTIQAILGIGLTLLFMYTFIPNLFPSFGFLLALGFGLGPGQAFAIGKGWESMGFEGGGNLGLVFAALGYIWGCFGGIYLISAARRRGWMDAAKIDAIAQKRIRKGVYGPMDKRPIGSHLTTESEAIDTMSYNLAAILGVYFLAYLLLKLLTWLLSFAGPTGTQLATNLWGISFVFAAIVALLVKKLFALMRVSFTLDNGSLTRVAGASVDIMLAASVAAISLVLFSKYWVPVLIVAVAGGIVTTITVIWACSRVFRDHRFDWTLMIYGNMTGTVSTGLAFLRIIDPDYETPVATDYMYSSGLTFVLCIPFILMLNLPGQWFVTGNPVYLWLTLAGLGLYLVFSIVSYVVLAGKHRFRRFLSLWYPD
jgi:glutamate:Na+ symporter, ESS family